jgi:hypothetical protein
MNSLRNEIATGTEKRKSLLSIQKLFTQKRNVNSQGGPAASQLEKLAASPDHD